MVNICTTLSFIMFIILKEKRRGKVTKGVLFLHDNTPAHRTLVTQNKLAKLAPSDYHLFPGLKKQLKGRHFSSHAEVIAAVETWLDGQIPDFFFECCIVWSL